MNPTSIVAWWGAILSTGVFAWDIYKYRSAGPKLRFTAQTGMETVNAPFYEGKTLIVANVTNYGDRPTTITTVAFEYFKGSRRWRKKKPDKAATNSECHTTTSIRIKAWCRLDWTYYSKPGNRRVGHDGDPRHAGISLAHRETVAAAYCH